MTWTQHAPPKDDQYTKHLSIYRNGDMYAMLSLDYGINNNSMFPGLADNYSVQTRTRHQTDTFIQMQEVKKGSLKISTRNFKVLKSAEKYLFKWMAANP